MNIKLIVAKLRCGGKNYLLVQIRDQIINTTPKKELADHAVFLADLLGLPVVLIGLTSANKPAAYGPQDLLQCVPIDRLSEIQWQKLQFGVVG